MNPIDGSILPDSDIVNNVHISRCLFFVSNLLEEMGKKKPSQQKQYESEFQLTPEAASKVYIAERTGIATFVKEINKVIPDNMKPLAASKVTQWLVSAGYLEEQERSDGHNLSLQLNSKHQLESHLYGEMALKDSIWQSPMIPALSISSLRICSSYNSISPRFSIFS